MGNQKPEITFLKATSVLRTFKVFLLLLRHPLLLLANILCPKCLMELQPFSHLDSVGDWPSGVSVKFVSMVYWFE